MNSNAIEAALQVIKRGCGELLVEEELAGKIKTGRPLVVEPTEFVTDTEKLPV